MTPYQVATQADAYAYNAVNAYKALNPHHIGISVDGAGSTPAIGVKGYAIAQHAGTISNFTIVANGTTPSCVWRVWRVPFALSGGELPTVSDDMVGGGTPPALSASNVATGVILDWDHLLVAPDDIIGFELVSRSGTGLTQITFTLEITP
jgi:hypothetical protein